MDGNLDRVILTRYHGDLVTLKGSRGTILLELHVEVQTNREIEEDATSLVILDNESAIELAYALLAKATGKDDDNDADR